MENAVCPLGRCGYTGFMSIEFNPGDPSHSTYANDPVPSSSKMVGWVMKTGLMHDEKQANYVLIILATLFFLATIWVMLGDTSPVNTDVMYLEDLSLEVLETLTPEERASIPSRAN